MTSRPMGFWAIPLLQTADIIIYKADKVPVGIDQVPHVELSREIARRFNSLYGPVFPPPEPMLTEVPKLLGIDGRKMSKSYNNAIYISDSPQEIRSKVGQMFTDPQRIKRSDPGNPDICNVFAFHRVYSSPEMVERVNVDCRRAAIGCVEDKKNLAENIVAYLSPIHEKRRPIPAKPSTLGRRSPGGWLSEGARVDFRTDHGRGAAGDELRLKKIQEGRSFAGAPDPTGTTEERNGTEPLPDEFEPQELPLKVKLEVFEGPLDLLLHLIKKERDRYLRHPHHGHHPAIPGIPGDDEELESGHRRRISPDGRHAPAHQIQDALAPLGGTSRPRRSEEGVEEDPRAELVRRLLEYQRFKEAALGLDQGFLLDREVFARRFFEEKFLEGAEEALAGEATLFDLLEAMKKVLQGIPPEEFQEISLDHLSIKEKIHQIMEQLWEEESVTFEELFHARRPPGGRSSSPSWLSWSFCACG